MNIHEYQAKELFRNYKIAVPEGTIALRESDLQTAITSVPGAVLVVKSQIHAGGRGKAGGVKLAKTHEQAMEYAKLMFGKILVTHQTGPVGQKVNRVYIESGSDIEKEYYLSLVIDRSEDALVFVASSEGGVDIEEVAAHNPEKIIKVAVRGENISGFHARKLGFELGFSGEVLKQFVDIVLKIYKLFVELDASQIEINPLTLTKQGNLIALDAKINFDDSALFRQKQVLALRDTDEEDPLEFRAKNHDLSYVKMDGNIGCMVNGAGLAMATMDIIKHYGGAPANFLDVGGSADKARVTEAFKIILSDTSVKAILVNIFGGIMRCDIIAEGIIAAAKEVGMKIPLIVRLAGTNFELGKKLLAESGLEITAADDLEDAAKKAVASIGGV